MRTVIYIFIGLIGILGCVKPRYVVRDDRLFSQASSCERKFSGFKCVELKWDVLPVVNEDASLVLVVTDENGKLVDLPVLPFVELFMPDHHHGSSLVDVTRLGTGLYRAEHLNFFMVGRWEIRAQLKNGDQVLEQVVWETTL